MCKTGWMDRRGKSGRTRVVAVCIALFVGTLIISPGRHGAASAASPLPLAAFDSIEKHADESGPQDAGMRRRMRQGRVRRQQTRRATPNTVVKKPQIQRKKKVVRKKKKKKAKKTKAATVSAPAPVKNAINPAIVGIPEQAPGTDNQPSENNGPYVSLDTDESGSTIATIPIRSPNVEVTNEPHTEQPDNGGGHGHGPNQDEGESNPNSQGEDEYTNDTPRDRPAGDWQPDRGRADQGRPDFGRPVADAVCVGGRMLGGKCECGPRRTLHSLQRRVFICTPRQSKPEIPDADYSIELSSADSSQGLNNDPLGGENQSSAAIVADALPDFVPDQVLVLVEPEAPESLEDEVAESFNLELVDRWSLEFLGTRLVLFRIPDGRAVEAVVALLQADARIGDPQPNYHYANQSGPSPSHEHGAALELQYALAKLDIGRAHTITKGDDVMVAVIDSEIDGTHPDLSEALEEKFNAAAETSEENNDHGTAIAGIISARGMTTGVAPNAKLLGVNALVPVDGGGKAATTATLLRGLNWAVGKQADIINLSLAGPRDDMVESGILTAADDGVIVVAAAGNEGPDAPPVYPAAYADVIAVTATDVNDRLYTGANHGSFIDIAAPGVDVLTPSLGHSHLLQTGTSFAAAHVTGIIALILERNPALGLEDIRRILSTAAVDIGPDGQDEKFGARIANAYSALIRIKPDAPAETELDRLSRMLSAQ